MVRNTKQSRPDMKRRRLLQGAGAAGITAIAGCLGGSDDEATFDVTMEVNADNDDRVQMVELIAESMEQTGYFNVDVETFEWGDYVQRVLDTGYGDNGYLPCIGLGGTFSPHSFCEALHHSDNHGQCCNLVGVNISELDEALDAARFGADVAEDDELRRERYDEVWNMLADVRASSITHFDLEAGVVNTDVHGYRHWPFQQTLIGNFMYLPTEEQVTWIDRSDATPDETDLSDLQEGDTIRIGVAENPVSFDPPYSTDTTSTIAQDLIFETLTRNDAEGVLYPWLAESYELVETNDIQRVDYADYMETVSVEEGVPDHDGQIYITHPEDNPAEDDEVRILTRDGAAAAIEDGVFGMQYRYTLREGVEFHDGTEMTAEDVVASGFRQENSDISAQTFNSTLYYDEVDEYTVDIYAQIPDAEAERNLPPGAVMPKEYAEMEASAVDPRQGVDQPIGTGPYELADFEEQQYIEYSKFDSYWVEQMGVDSIDWFDGPSEFPDGPVIDTVEMSIVPENSSRSAALQSDEIDMTYGLTTDTLDEYDESDDYIVDSVEAGGYEYIQYPLNVEPWDDERLRKAVNHLVPRQSIVDNVLNGWARPAWTDIPSLAQGTGTADYDALESEIKPKNEYDPERAEELIEEVIEDHDL
ncbi:ABC transporter substrate-binding protein [Natronorubrum sp. DTA7]|uniref:ABC transporter substrate-binding protein n=1 Tax=Natronorubrum sp. DTA7 TaxID=3447016 RepID=UPI003F8749A3